MAALWKEIQNNFLFVCLSLAIGVGLHLLSKLAERKLPPRRISSARRLCIISICSAIAAVLHIFDFPLPFLAPGFYKLDFSEVPVMLCGFYLGPSACVACEGLKILLKLLLKSTSTAFVGDFANFAVGCSLVLPAVIVYHTRKNRKTALLGLILGTLFLTVFGSAFNGIYLIPKFAELFGIPVETIIAMGNQICSNITSIPTFVFWAVVPLNLIKGITVSVLTLLLYKRVARPLFEKGH